MALKGTNGEMSAEVFCAFLTEMKDRGYNKAQVGEMLGHGAPWVSRAQVTGADRTTALACAAILHGIEPMLTVAHARSSGRRSAHPDQPSTGSAAP
jgi:hypothetical protein